MCVPVGKEGNRMKGTRIKGSCLKLLHMGIHILFSLPFSMFENFQNKKNKVAHFGITLYLQWSLLWVGPVLFVLDTTH